MIKENSIYNKIYKHQVCSCFYCKEPTPIYMMDKEHVYPRSKGGRGIKNKVLSCLYCNRIKENLTISDFKIKVQKLLEMEKDNILIQKYKNIIDTLTYLMDGGDVRKNWHKKTPYQPNGIDRKPIRIIQN